MLSTKSEYLPQSQALILFRINKPFCKERIYGKYISYISLVMQFADGGDLYQKIVSYKKKKQHF